MTPCEATRAVSLELRDFLHHVPDVKETAVCDYLLWKWRAADPRFHFVNVPRLLREAGAGPSESGAAYAATEVFLELWILGKRAHLPLALLARRFTRTWDAYVARLAAPEGSCRHLITLTATAEARGLHPFVLVTSVPDERTLTACGQGASAEGGLFLLGADAAAAVADGAHTSRVSKNRLLALCDPLPCMICRACPDALVCLSPRLEALQPRSNRRLPAYVRRIAAGEPTAATAVTEAGLHRYLAVCVYDLSDTAWP